MAFTRTDLKTEAKATAQDSGAVPLLKSDPADYTEAMDQAIRMFSQDRPNLRVVHQVLAATGFRQVLFGAGNLSALTGLDAWQDGASGLEQVWYPYIASQDEDPIDPNEYKIVRDPGPKVILHFKAVTPTAGQTLRLEFVNPHVVHASDSLQSTVRESDREPLVMLTAAMICILAAVRFAQNTGNTNLPNDVVDRRSQSDVMKSRAEDLMKRYNQIVGKGKPEDLKGASAFGELDVTSSHPWGLIWHPTRAR